MADRELRHILKRRRMELGLTQEQVAEVLECEGCSISLAETGKMGLGEAKLVVLAQFYRLDPVEVLLLHKLERTRGIAKHYWELALRAYREIGGGKKSGRSDRPIRAGPDGETGVLGHRLPQHAQEPGVSEEDQAGLTNSPDEEDWSCLS